MRAVLGQGARLVHGLDLSRENLRSISVLYQDAIAAGRAAPVLGNILSLPYPDETFDFVYSIGVIHHSPSAEGCVAELARVLKRGGYLHLHVFGRGGIMRHALKALRGFHRAFVPFGIAQRLWGKLLPPRIAMAFLDGFYVPIQRNFHFREIAHILQEAGLEEIRRLSSPKIECGWLEKLLRPAAWEYDSPVSRILFGSGYVSVIARKPT